ncbi:fimbrial biogenesis chaperone [Dryocola clanedunensis]
MKVIRNTLFTCLLAILSITAANAGVIIGGTRVIYDGGKKESSLSVSNPDNVPYLIQSWIETQSGGAEKAPFVITPPLFRLNQGQQNVMRIVRAGNLAENKESMYWLNIKSIPSSPKKDNTLQIAVKTRIKLIYRPEALKGKVPGELAEQLKWTRVGDELQVTNPTGYYMNFNEIKVGGKSLPDVTYVAPGANTKFKMAGNSGAITFRLITDFGAQGEIHQVKM